MLTATSSETNPETVLDHFLAPASVLATITLLTTGFNAALAVVLRQTSDELAHAVNVGIARGFIVGFAPTVAAFLGALSSVA